MTVVNFVFVVFNTILHSAWVGIVFRIYGACRKKELASMAIMWMTEVL